VNHGSPGGISSQRPRDRLCVAPFARASDEHDVTRRHARTTHCRPHAPSLHAHARPANAGAHRETYATVTTVARVAASIAARSCTYEARPNATIDHGKATMSANAMRARRSRRSRASYGATSLGNAGGRNVESPGGGA